MVLSFFSVFELLGTIAFAVSGAMVAIDKRVDLFGVLFLGVITALGGGVIRDMTLGFFPPHMYLDRTNLAVALLTGLVVFWVARLLQDHYLHHEAFIEQINNVFDALGLGAFSVTGVKVAMEMGYGDNLVLLLCMGLTTAIGGGILRDLLIGEIPFVLKKRVYAVASLCGAAGYCMLWELGAGEGLAVFGGVFATFLLRMLATFFKWNLPKAIR